MMLLPNNGSARFGHSWMIAQQEQVFSRGKLTLLSRDPTVDPLVEQRLLTDERDVVRMRDALARIREVLEHPAVASILDGPPSLPAPEELPMVVTDTVHVCSTCRMGSPDDVTTVVDPDCRVLGTAGLRVVDASIIPEVPRANLHLTVVMIAEQAAGRMRAGG
jgi:choline dehydrogenase-like flavoprotein